MSSVRGRAARLGLVGALGLALGAPLAIVGGTFAFLDGTAGASFTGTVTLSGSTLQIANSGSLTWATSISGLDQNVVDSTAADQGITINDATGSGAGWHVTVAQTQFSDGHSNTLPFITLNGSTGSATDTTALNSACFGGNSCTNASNSIGGYPITLSTSASSIFSTAANSGIGKVGIGTGSFGVSGNNPIGWWVSIPASAIAGSYTSMITEAVVSGP